MTKRILGKDLEVSSIGLGIMGMDHGYGKAADRQEMIELIRHSVELGGNFFDTAPVYGKANEVLLGQAVQPIRDKVVIATKFGIVGQKVEQGQLINELDSRPQSILEQVDTSLKNLGVDTIDLYYQHRVDPKVAPEEVADTMGSLIKAGKIKHWGVSNAPLDYIRRAHAITPITAMENQYSMVYRYPEEELFDFCQQNQIGFVAYSPLGNGFLTGKVNPQAIQAKGDLRGMMARFKPDVLAQNQVVLDYLAELSAEKSATPAQIVLAWALAQRDFIVPIPGTTKRHRLEENLAAMTLELTPAELAEINRRLDAMHLNQSHF